MNYGYTWDADNKHEVYVYLLHDVIDIAIRVKHKWVIQKQKKCAKLSMLMPCINTLYLSPITAQFYQVWFVFMPHRNCNGHCVYLSNLLETVFCRNRWVYFRLLGRSVRYGSQSTVPRPKSVGRVQVGSDVLWHVHGDCAPSVWVRESSVLTYCIPEPCINPTIS